MLKDHLSFQRKTNQSDPIPGREKEMHKNAAGGYVFSVDDQTRLERFLILGTDGGTYYCDEKEHTVDNFKAILKYLNKDASSVLETTSKLSDEGRILKNDTAIAVLAIAWANGYRKEVETVFDKIIRIPTHLFMFMDFIKQVYNGKFKSSRRMRRMLGNWYYNNPNLVYHMLKYQSRQGWSHRDVIRLAHIQPKDKLMDNLFGFITGKDKTPEHPLVEAFIKLRQATTAMEVTDIIKNYNVTWEFVPTQFLKEKEVWEALLPNLPLTALLRNLGRLTALGVVEEFSDNARYVADRLTNIDNIKKARIHPVNVGIAMHTYSEGISHRGSLLWNPVRIIEEALDEMFYHSFANVEVTNKRFLIGIDASGSMTWQNVANTAMHSLDAATLVSLPILTKEPNSVAVGFDTKYQRLRVTKNTGWKDLRYQFNLGGGTDASLPFKYAIDNKTPVDVFVIFTDNETWYGDEHPVQALERYRDKMGINSKLIVASMTATDSSIADPNDPYQVDVVGFDPSYPKIINEVAKMK